jgi:ethanolamine-phosphate cytidylyltransferase
VQFSSGKTPAPGQRIVYVAGAFDLFNVGDIELLAKVRELGDFVLVGIHTDREVNERMGGGFPIMNLHERSLSVLSCRHVDEVIIGAPLKVTKDLCTSMNVSVVVVEEESIADLRGQDAYSVPQELGILQPIRVVKSVTVQSTIDRIMRNRERFQERFDAKQAKDATYYQQKQFVQEV